MTANQPAGWYRDPSRRHEHRYWDGARWTDHVSNKGITTSDPIRDRGSPVARSAGDASTLTRAERQAQLRRGGQRTQQSGPIQPSPPTPAATTSSAPLPVTTNASKRTLTRGQAIGGIVVLLVIIGAVLSAAGVKTNSGSSGNAVGSSSSQSLSEWATQNLPSVHALQNALHDVGTTATAGDLVGLGAACTSLQSASLSMADGLPSPNAPLNDALTKATTDFTSAATSCINGVNDNDSTEIDQATSEIQAGTAQINIATGILDQVNSGG